MYDVADVRACRSCHKRKPITEYYRSKSKKGGYSTVCKTCQDEQNHEWMLANIEKRRKHGRDWYHRNKEQQLAKRNRDAARAFQLRRNYGITAEQYAVMLEAQGGVCAICRQSETAKNVKGEIRALAVDHDHETGAVRGLLCQLCNQGLGAFRDNAVFLQAAIEYLEVERADKAA